MEQGHARGVIGEFEGLRGLLATWVVFGHILLFSGYSWQQGWFGIVFSPVLGVYTFMMLSGFVIIAALDQRPTGWLEFMKRRFWRIFPVYGFCLLLALLMFRVSASNAGNLPTGPFRTETSARLLDVSRDPAIHIAADATLLQCLVPRAWYPSAHESFLPPTWSLTLEWLFYLVAPVWCAVASRSRWLAWGAALLLVIFVYAREEFLTDSWNRSFHCGNVLHFLTGMASYYVWKHFHPPHTGGTRLKLLFWGVVAAVFFAGGIPYKIWAVTMVLVLYRRVHAGSFKLLEWPRRILLSRPVQFLGRTSYVTYLLHWLMIELVFFWIVMWRGSNVSPPMMAMLSTAIVYPLTWIAAHAIHQAIEAPLMRRGRTAEGSARRVLFTAWKPDA